MIDTKLLRQKILDLAIRGKLVPQDPNDEPASELLKRIKAEKEALIKAGKIKRDKHESYIFRGEDKRYYEQIDGKTVDITEEIPFDIPDSWEWCRLNAIGTNMYGVNESAQREGTYKLLRITDIQNDSVDWNLVPYTNYSGIVEPYFLQKGDIVFARTGATVGKSFLIQSPPSRAIYASYLIRVRFVLPALAEYIKVFFGTPCYWSQITQKTVGTGQPNVNGTSLAGLLLPLPPLNEQKRIVSQVESLLKYIDEIDENAVSLENTISLTKQKILDLAIRGKLVPQDPNDEPASELLKKIKAEKETLIKSGKLKRDKHESFIFRGDDNCYYEQIDEKSVDITEDIPFDIPESWSWCRLGSFANIIMGQSPDGSSVNNSGSGIEFHQGKIYFGERFLQPSTQRTIAPTRVVPAKSVLICVRAPVGIVNITNREICIGRGLAAAIPFHGISESFLAYWISARKNSLIEGATGSTFLAVSVDQVKGLLIPIPPLSEQQRITEKTAEINLALEATLE